MSGRALERVVVVTARARSLPDLTGSIDADMGSNIICVWPAIRFASAGPPPAKWTMGRLRPVIFMNSRPETCGELPTPVDAILILPDSAFAMATNSATLLTATEGCTTRTNASRDASDWNDILLEVEGQVR